MGEVTSRKQFSDSGGNVVSIYVANGLNVLESLVSNYRPEKKAVE